MDDCSQPHAPLQMFTGGETITPKKLSLVSLSLFVHQVYICMQLARVKNIKSKVITTCKNLKGIATVCGENRNNCRSTEDK